MFEKPNASDLRSRSIDAEFAAILRETQPVDVTGRGFVSGLLSGGYLSVFRGAGIEFEDVREYSEGDDPRSVDWNVTARVGRPFVKRFVDERQTTLVFLVDVSRSMDTTYGAYSGRRAAARIAAALGLAAVRNNDRVGGIFFAGHVLQVIPPNRGPSHVFRLVKSILTQDAVQDATVFERVLDYVARVFKRRVVLVILSDFLSNMTPRSLQSCTALHQVIACRLRGQEMDPPRFGLWNLKDPESGTVYRLDLSREDERRQLINGLEKHDLHLESELKTSGADLISFRIPATPDRQAILRPLLRFLGGTVSRSSGGNQ